MEAEDEVVDGSELLAELDRENGWRRRRRRDIEDDGESEEEEEDALATVRAMFLQLLQRLNMQRYREENPAQRAMQSELEAADSMRDELIRLARQGKTLGGRKKFRFPGFSPAYEMAWSRLVENQLFACSSCGAWICRPEDLLEEDDQAARVALEDSGGKHENDLVLRDCNVVTKHGEEPLHVQQKPWVYEVEAVFCPKCKVSLGARIVSVSWKQCGDQVLPCTSADDEELGTKDSGDECNLGIDEHQAIVSTLYNTWTNIEGSQEVSPMDQKVVRRALKAARAASSDQRHDSAPRRRPRKQRVIGVKHNVHGFARVSPPRSTFVKRESNRVVYVPLDGTTYLGVLEIGQTTLCSRYLQLVEARNAQPVRSLQRPLILCGTVQRSSDGDWRECNSILSSTDQILCTKRCWNPSDGDGHPINANYMNGVNLENVNVCNIRLETLPQGVYEMGDLVCSRCKVQVGYKFVRDKSEEGKCRHQAGRFGLFTSRVKVHHPSR